MAFEKFDLENLDKERRKAVAKSIRTMSEEELKALGNEIFRYADDPWREKFFRFIAENPGAIFHHRDDAITSPLRIWIFPLVLGNGVTHFPQFTGEECCRFVLTMR